MDAARKKKKVRQESSKAIVTAKVRETGLLKGH
jgi:hypothetical protein